MKLTSNSQFTPITLTLTIETLEEARAFYAIFNHTDNQQLLGEDNAERWKSAIGHCYYTKGLIANEVWYRDFYPGKNSS